MKQTRGAAIAVIAASLITSGCMSDWDPPSSGGTMSGSRMVRCYGINHCNGKNGCKEQGWVEEEYQKCLNQGGRPE